MNNRTILVTGGTGSFGKRFIRIDHVYDGGIRADLLVSVLGDYLERGELSRSEQPESGETYYVIHPVLKHVAVLSLDS